MTVKAVRVAVSVSLFTLASCASTDDAARSSDSTAAPVVVKMRFRDVDLVVSGGGSGQRFSVVERGRMPLASGLEEADFRRHHPDLYEVYRSGLARAPYLDARLDRPLLERSSAPRF